MPGKNCAVVGCPACQSRHKGLSFFQIRRKNNIEWENALVRAVNRSDASFNRERASICSRHFKEECFKTDEGSERMVLIPGSLPTEFMPKKSTLPSRKPRRIKTNFPDEMESFDEALVSEVKLETDIAEETPVSWMTQPAPDQRQNRVPEVQHQHLSSTNVKSPERDQEMPQWAKELFRTMSQLLVRVEEMDKKLDGLIRQSGCQPENHMEVLPEGLTFPLTSLEELDFLERLLEDPVKERAVLHILKVVGGSTAKEATTSILLRVLGPKHLAEKLCWTGSKDKKEFKSLRLRAVLCKAVRQNARTKDVTDEEVKKAAQDFFRNARDRCGGRRQRMPFTEIMPVYLEMAEHQAEME